MRHAVLTRRDLVGFEYATLRALEDAIVSATNAVLVESPPVQLPSSVARRIEHGTRYAGLRRFVPKRAWHHERFDVLWVPLMGPEAFNLDLFSGWTHRVGMKILYLFDTFQAQFPALRRVLDAADWDVLVTSFPCAVRALEEGTQRRWHAVMQGVDTRGFRGAPAGERLIAFSAYGRRLEGPHEAVRRFAQESGLYYDYSVARTVRKDIPSRDLGLLHAWHLGHSTFTFCWPVEHTHPERAGSFSPVTARWFEAAACGAVILGQAPSDPSFLREFGADAVVPIDPELRAGPHASDKLDALWETRGALLAAAAERRATRASGWSWDARVEELIALAGLREL